MKKGISILLLFVLLWGNGMIAKAEEGWLWPTGAAYGYGYITSSYGFRTYNNRNHNGIDCGAPHGAQVLASKRGVVLESSFDNSRGNYIILDHGNGYHTVSMHLSQRTVSVGETVSRGQVIGLVGKTGAADGAHLHFEIKYNGSYYNPNPVDYPIQGSVVNGKRGEIAYAFDVQGGMGTAIYSKNGITEPNQLLRQGSTGTSVMELQYSLNVLLGEKLSIDGIYGSKTVTAVKQFQTKNGLFADGIAGPNTNNKINALMGQTKKTVKLSIGSSVMWVNQESQEIEAPIKKQGRTLLPVRPIMEVFGASVIWNGTEQSVEISRQGDVVKFWIGSTVIYRNGERYQSDVAPIMVNGRCFLPIRFVAESLGLTVSWNETNQTVTIEEE